MIETRKTLAELFGTYAVDRDLFERIALKAWPVMRKVTVGFTPDPTSHTLLTAQITEAIRKATGANAQRIILVSNGGSAFISTSATAYGEDLEFGKSLTCRLMDRWRPHFAARSTDLGSHPSWVVLKETIWTGLIDAVGDDIADIDAFQQMSTMPKSTAADSYLTLLLCYFAAGILGDEGAVNQLQPLLDMAPVLLPLGETSTQDTWKCVVVGAPLVIKSF